MEAPAYEISAVLPLPYERAVARVREELQKEGFGVLTEIDVRDTLKKKLQLDFRKYVILGACNPPLAHEALSAELSIGLLLPCNLVVYETHPGESVVAAFDPMIMAGLVEHKAEIGEIAGRVRAKIQRVIAAAAR